MNKPTISVSNIMMNEINTVELFLEQFQDKDIIEEIVVLDGDSTDGTLDILKSCPKVKLMIQPQKVTRYGNGWNEGNRRNKNLSACTGDYILMVDADEVLDDAFFDDAEGILVNNPDSICFGFHRVNYYRDCHHLINNPPRPGFTGGMPRLWKNIPQIRYKEYQDHSPVQYNGTTLVYSEYIHRLPYCIHHLHRMRYGLKAIARDHADETGKILDFSNDHIEREIKKGKITKFNGPYPDLFHKYGLATS